MAQLRIPSCLIKINHYINIINEVIYLSKYSFFSLAHLLLNDNEHGIVDDDIDHVHKDNTMTYIRI